MLTITPTLLKDTMHEIADALAAEVDATVVVSARPVDAVVAPQLVVTAGASWMQPGGSLCERLIGLAVVIYAGRYDLAGTWDQLTDLSELAYRTLEDLPRMDVTSLARAGRYTVAGVDHLGAVINFNVYR
jgi:hypothetical protein